MIVHHEVQQGETLSAIARQHRSTPGAIAQANPWVRLVKPGGIHDIEPGWVLAVPTVEVVEPPSVDKHDPRTTIGVYPQAGRYSGPFYKRITDECGRQFDFICCNTDHTSWSKFGASSWGLFVDSDGVFVQNADRIPTLKSLTTVAQRVEARCPGRKIARIGHEPFVGYPWQVHGWEDVPSNESDAVIARKGRYIDAFRYIATFLKQRGTGWLIDYQGNGPWSLTNNHPEGNGRWLYPGNDVVDIIGVDVYDVRPWADVKARLDYTHAFARDHGKQMSIPEWGIWLNDNNVKAGAHGDNPAFIQNMYDWMSGLPATGPGSMAYHNYFWGIADCNLFNAPRSLDKFKALFC